MALEVEYADNKLEDLEYDLGGDRAYPAGIGRAFRNRIQFIRAATNIQQLRNMKSWRFEKLKGNRSHQHSARLNDQWRLILEIEEGSPNTIVRVISIEDYH